MKILFLIIAVTTSGDEYVAGSGDSCAAAWEQAVIPADWQKLTCERR